jgi:hypothetical protein
MCNRTRFGSARFIRRGAGWPLAGAHVAARESRRRWKGSARKRPGRDAE